MLGRPDANDRLPYFSERVAIDDRRLADPDVALEDLAPSQEGATS
jgi:hypothetical protein